MLTLSLAAGCRLNLVRQHLAGPPVRPTPDGILQIVRDLGYVQLDPTSAVARSHLLVLWSRLGLFDPPIVERLLTRQRQLVEYIRMDLGPECDPDARVPAWGREDHGRGTAQRPAPLGSGRAGGA